VSYQPNEQIVQGLIDACIYGKYKKLNDFLSEDITFHIPGRNPIAGTHRGIAALIKLSYRVQSQAQYYPLTTTHVHTVSGPTYVATTSFKESTIENATINWQSKSLFFFHGSLIAACWVFIDDQCAFNRYWSQPLPTTTGTIRHSKPNTYPGIVSINYLPVDI
jgi:hypothetical protein